MVHKFVPMGSTFTGAGGFNFSRIELNSFFLKFHKGISLSGIGDFEQRTIKLIKIRHLYSTKSFVPYYLVFHSVVKERPEQNRLHFVQGLSNKLTLRRTENRTYINKPKTTINIQGF